MLRCCGYTRFSFFFEKIFFEKLAFTVFSYNFNLLKFIKESQTIKYAFVFSLYFRF